MQRIWIGLIVFVGVVLAFTVPYLLPLYALMALFGILSRRRTGQTNPYYRAFVYGIAVAIIIYSLILLLTLVTAPAA